MTDDAKRVIRELLGRADRDYRAGRVEQAAGIYRRVIEAEPDNGPANNGLGIIAFGSDQPDLALKFFSIAVHAQPSSPHFHCNLGNVLRAMGRLDECLASYGKSIELNPYFAEAYNNLGSALADMGRWDEAVECFKKAIDLKPTYADAHCSLGNTLRRAGRMDEAVVSLRTAITLVPKAAEAHNALGNALADVRCWDEAIDCYHAAIALEPDHRNAPYNLGLALGALKRWEDAIPWFQRAVALAPDSAVVHSDLGNALKESGRMERSVDSYRAAVALDPRLAMAHSNLGRALHHLGAAEEAIACYRTALALAPGVAETHVNLGLALLSAGEVDEGLWEWEWRLRQPNNRAVLDSFQRPMLGRDADYGAKTVLVWGEQGVGDQLIWSAFVPMVIAGAGRCLLECRPKLVPLFTRSFPGAEVRPMDRSRYHTRTDFDFHIPVGSLPWLLGPRYVAAELGEAFLAADPARVAFWKSRLAALGCGPFIGMSWTSANVDPTRALGYTTIDAWEPVFATTGAVFVSLQYGDAGKDVAEARTRFGVVVHVFEDLDLYDDLDEVAALAAALDVVISVDTAVAAIVAGVGTPLWRLTWRQSEAAAPIFRLRGPSVSEFHRNTGETWDNAFNDIAGRLREL